MTSQLSPKDNSVWIVSHDSQKELALAVVEECKKSVSKMIGAGDLKVGRNFEYKDILEWKKFQDGFPNLFITNVKEMAGKDVVFIASFHSVDVIFEQLSMLNQMARYLPHSLTVILPYFPTGTMERIDVEGQVATAMTLADQLSIIPPTTQGPTRIMIFDIHALQERFYFSSQVALAVGTAIPLVVKIIRETYGSNVAIAFPDDGAHKRFYRLFPDEWPKIVCAKTCVGDKRLIRIMDGDASGKNVVIIDDLVQTGGTLLETGKALRKAGAASVSAYVTHPVFPKESWRQFIFATDAESRIHAESKIHDDTKSRQKPSGTFDNFWITDSIPHARTIAKYPPFKLISLSTAIATALTGFDSQA